MGLRFMEFRGGKRKPIRGGHNRMAECSVQVIGGSGINVGKVHEGLGCLGLAISGRLGIQVVNRKLQRDFGNRNQVERTGKRSMGVFSHDGTKRQLGVLYEALPKKRFVACSLSRSRQGPSPDRWWRRRAVKGFQFSIDSGTRTKKRLRAFYYPKSLILAGISVRHSNQYPMAVVRIHQAGRPGLRQ